ncbi:MULTISPECIES: DNA cytosine methyltransferase [unclassified Corallococcus]|uniref:DNA cytosine methyltransferase n=1 Tax=unclassified Corallococcus TaxID=2685029 RepID=UPI001A9033E7|nr:MULTISPECIES: DNA cytosine methyltransferase [unclassified Corallococcus]MBN9687153.1 DNA cytosine methyltransferase [Corallococcus sp. NCSPR001]WAS89020.1 DNA cytosine methyltransferase [Corallococcus sp. NCRR]
MKRNCRGLVVDLFAGGGGASTGIEAALGRDVDVAINHSATALAVHAANHPRTKHLTADIWDVPPREATGGRPVDVLWASPDCTHFSVAKGGTPREKGIRSLAWVVIDWARDVRPRCIFIENVAEFRTWGPLGEDGRPDKARMGETFEQWRGVLELMGYTVDFRVLDASLYGAPTKRRRLFLVARCDGQPVRWPEPTHGPGKLPLRTAADCIDWSLPCPSIFERKKPLAEKTLWRIAEGLRRFVLENPEPFIVGCGGRAGQTPPTPVGAPVGTITAKNDRALVVPSIIKVNHGGEASRGEPIDAPLSTVTAQRRGHALVVPTMVTIDHGTSSAGMTSADAPLPTVTTENRHAVVAPTLVQTGYGERPGQRARYLDLHQPLGTVVADGQKHALVSAFLSKHYGGVVGVPFDGRPLDTVTAQDHHALAAVTLAHFRGTGEGQPGARSVTESLPTITAGGIHVAEVRAFLTSYYGDDATSGQRVDRPLRTITAKARMGLVTVAGVEHQIVDIGMRMLEPEELLRAQFGRFAATYDLSAATSKAAKVRLIGNSVCPEAAEAVVRANLGDSFQELEAA